ncbi:MAG: GTP-binding protein, partial [bacterium]|nr:GTP-binding protein [bacterium]
EQGIFLYGNPIEVPPQEIIKRGNAEVGTYFNSLKKGYTISLNEVKVLLVGEGSSGKTSLTKRLMEKGFNEHEPQTHGISINAYRIAGEKEKIKLNLWDFGGQEIMHATHQFFLSKRSLYILVLDGRKDEKAEYWLKLIQSFGGSSPVLIVLNKIDQNPGFDVNQKFLLGKYENIAGFIRISCKTGEGIPNMVAQLENVATTVEISSTQWPAAWFDVKNIIEKSGKNFISYDEYRKVCVKEKVTEKSHQDTLVGFLHDLGIVLNFKDYQLEDTHVLNPGWVTEAVYQIINSGILAESKGVLELELLRKILQPAGNYPEDKHKYVIALMKKFELCFSITDNRVLIPDLLDVGELDFDFDYDSSLKLIYKYDFLPKSVLPRLMVRLRGDIKENLRWRSGVVLVNETFRATAIVKADEYDKIICMYINGRSKRDYCAVIRHTLQEINRDFENLKVTEFVAIPGTPSSVVSYEHLLRLEKEGVDDYYPDGSDGKYSVRSLLGAIEKKKEEEDETLRRLDLSKMHQEDKKFSLTGQ